MANTTIPSELIADGAITSAKLDTNIAVGGTLTVTGDANFDSNTLFVDASANAVGIGTTSPTSALHITATHPTVYLETSGGGATDAAYLQKYSNDVYLYNKESAGNLYLGTNNATKVTLDSNGNLLVGTTSDIAHVTSASGEGIALSAGSYGGFIGATRNSDVVLEVNRTGTNGDIVRFKKSGSLVGSIGTGYGSVDIKGGTSGLLMGNAAVLPVNGSGTLTTGSYDIGLSSFQFKDLYLSGGVVFGATGGAVSSKTLDDYEEGTWTPVFSNAGTPSYTTQYGRYTKVGRIVYCSIAIGANSVSSASTIGLDGLPFASPDHGDAGQRSCFIVANSGHLSSLSEATARFRINGSSMQGVKGNATTTYMTASEMTSSGTIAFAGAFLYYT